MNTRRLFFALWPDAVIRQQCLDIQAMLPPGVSLTKAHNMHVTLVFLGNINTRTEQALQQAVTHIRLPEIQLSFERLSFWSQPGILCLRNTQNVPELCEFVVQLTDIAQQLAIPIDPHPYKPHITLARKAKQTCTISFSPITWRTHTFCLVNSCTTDAGVEYQIVKSWGE